MPPELSTSRSFGYSPAVGVLVVDYRIGQLGGNISLPGGSGGLDLGLIGMFALLHQPLAVTTAAVVVYHASSLSIAAPLNSVAYYKLRRTLQREPQAAAMCMPLAEPDRDGEAAVPLMRPPAAKSHRGCQCRRRSSFKLAT